MISFKELLSGHSISEVEISIQYNLEDLLIKINKLREAYGHPMVITSGLRTEQDQIRIYSTINAERLKQGLKELSVPMGSAHLKGCACDALDKDGSLMKWTKENEKLLEEIGLWVEDDTSQPRVHYQSYAPKSEKRFFKP